MIAVPEFALVRKVQNKVKSMVQSLWYELVQVFYREKSMLQAVPSLSTKVNL